MSIVLKRIDMHAARPHMHFFALALVGHMDAAPTNMDFLAPAFVSHMDAAPANMDLFAFVGINNVDAAREGNIDKWLIAAISVLSRRLSLVSHIRRLGVGATVLQVVGIVGRLPI